MAVVWLAVMFGIAFRIETPGLLLFNLINRLQIWVHLCRILFIVLQYFNRSTD